MTHLYKFSIFLKQNCLLKLKFT